jgi:hypothetical protein
MTKWPTSGDNGLTGTRAEEDLLLQQKIASKGRLCVCVFFCFIIYYAARSIKKDVTRCVTRNVMSGTMKYALARNARGNSGVADGLIRTVPPRDRNCTYGGTFSANCKEFSNFLKLKVKVKFTLKRATKAQRGSRDIYTLSLTSALDRGRWSTPRPGCFTPGNDSVPIVLEAGCAPRAGLDGCGKSRLHLDSIPEPSTPYRVAIPTAPSRLTSNFLIITILNTVIKKSDIHQATQNTYHHWYFIPFLYFTH